MSKVVMDIESMVDYKLYPYQQAMLDKISVGLKAGEMMTMSSGRQTGKSVLNAAYGRLWNDIMEANTKVSDMVLSEGTVYGSRYYCVQPVGGNWIEMEAWCGQVFGEGSRALWGEKKAPEPARRWYANNRKFWFKSEKDRDWFIVMWRA